MPALPTVRPASPSQDHVAFERMLAELSARFLILPPQEVDAAITDALHQIVKMLGVDRAQLMRFVSGGDVRVTHSWAVAGVPPVSPKSITDRFPWLLARVRAGEVVVIPSVADLPPEAGIDQASFRAPGTKANLTVPMRVAGRIEGALTFGCLRNEREWPEPLVERVRVLAAILANALAHKRTQEELAAAINFERKASEILSALLGAPRAQQDQLLEAGLRDVARALGAERATLWQRVEAEGLFRKTHRWLAEGVPAPADDMHMPTIPWISARLERGEVVSFARHDELPSSAAADVEALRKLHIGAGVIVPLRLSGQVAGALSIGTVREGPEWPHALVARVQLLGEAFASFLARQEAERREHMAQAQAAHAARVGTMGVFAASLVHELTQPIAASLSNAETAVDLLGARNPDLDDLRATVSDIVADGRRAGEMIQKLRRFLRHGEAERREFDLAALLAEVLHFVKPEATQQGVSIIQSGAEDLPHIVGDRVQLQQVLINLLLNAFEAVAGLDPQSRAVELRACQSESGVRIEVVDGGVGMDQATLTRIFRPFFTTKAAGMGLGLSISQTIVATHGGTLSVQSTPGAGSVFRIDLPARPPLSIKLAPPARVTPASGQTVFLIDDDDAMRRALERQLQGVGYEVVAFADAQAFVDRAPRADVACIVSDIRMPGMSGLDLQATLARANIEWPIVFMSGYADIPTTVHAIKAGAIAFLPKPFAKRELLAAVAEALARCRVSDQDRRQDAEILARHASLTPRERDVYDLVVAGLLNKVVADRLGIAETTVKIHRGRVMEKMGTRSIADLVRIAERIALHAAAASVPVSARTRAPDPERM